jgi:hypothetical protein
MMREKNLLFTPGALLLTLVVALPLYGQADLPQAKDQKADPKDAAEQKIPENKGSFKGELKSAIHACQLKAGQLYAIQVKTKNFRPMTQLRDKNLQTTYLSNSTTRLALVGGRQEYTQQFTYTPTKTADYNLVISPSSTLIKGAMEYTATISPVEALETIKDELTPSEPFYALRGECFHKVHKLEFKAGETYQIDLTGDFNPCLYLEDPLGNVLGSDNSSGGANNSRLYFQPATTDTYRLIATSRDVNATGSYTLNISDSPFDTVGPGVKKIIGPAGIVPPGGVPVNPKQPGKKKKVNRDNDINVKGELEPAKHTIKLNAGKPYVITVQTKEFRPSLRIYDKNGRLMSSRTGGVAKGMEYNLTVDWTPPTTDNFDLHLMTIGIATSTDPREYTIEVNPR